MTRRSTVVVAALTLVGALPVQAQNRPPSIQDLSLEDLMTIEVTSVSRKEQPVGKTAAAIFVITADEIRRSGATTLPDLLRFIPGFFVGEVNAKTWSIASRGFASIYGNKLLVLVDGMSLYDPASGGVTWEQHYLPLDMIARIEVVRGPGGSLWGANAINGVINIITKPADQTHGLTVSTRVDAMHPGTLDVSYGGGAGTAHQDTRLRFFQRQSANQLQGRDSDTSASFFASTRWDWGFGTRSQVTFSGHAQHEELTGRRAVADHHAAVQPTDVSGDGLLRGSCHVVLDNDTVQSGDQQSPGVLPRLVGRHFDLRHAQSHDRHRCATASPGRSAP